MTLTFRRFLEIKKFFNRVFLVFRIWFTTVYYVIEATFVYHSLSRGVAVSNSNSRGLGFSLFEGLFTVRPRYMNCQGTGKICSVELGMC